MTAKAARVLRALFTVYVVGTFAHIAYVVNHEPYAFDAWNVSHDTAAKPFSFGRFFSFWHQQYTTSNPRIGQPMAYLAYKVGGFAEIVTPLAFFAIVLAGFVLGAGRWPRRPSDQNGGRDLAVLAIGIGFAWFMAPNFPAYMFCRAYATNYIWLIAIQLWLLVPLRLYGASVTRPAAWKLALYIPLGIAAGMGNEHVGPTIALALVVFAVWTWRKHGRHSLLAWTAAGSVVVGYALLFFAPGQSQRYEGLAEHYTVFQQILVRGIAGNMDIFISLLEAASPLLVMMVIAIAVGIVTDERAESELGEVRAQQRTTLRFIGVALAACALITITVFASPKLGARFYLHAGALMLACMMGVASVFLHRTKSFVPFVVVAILASVYAGARTIPLYGRLARASDHRLAGLNASTPGTIYTADAWEPMPETWWSLGDDARDQKKREMIATYFGLDRVLYRGGDLWKALGVTDIKLTMHYDIEPAMCLDQVDKLDIAQYIGRDVGALHHAFLDALAETRRVTGVHIKKADLTATFLGTEPPMPAKTLYVAKWTEHDGLIGYPAQIKRAGRSRDRQLVLPAGLKKEPWDIYVVRIGDTPKKIGISTDSKPPAYEPWGSGTYWALACREDACFVIFSASHVI